MIEIHKANSRGQTRIDWLTSYHSFSFGEYYDPKYMHFSFLRVINEDFIAPKSGFPMHSHNDMEIITYIMSGELTHKDSLGNIDSIKAGEIQLMRAGSGITHSEYNFDQSAPIHLLQIWIIPREKNLQPSYQQKDFSATIQANELCKVISPNKEDNLLHIEQDVEIYVAKLSNKVINYHIEPQHKIWLQVVKGNLNVNGQDLSSGDGAGIHNESQLTMEGSSDTEFLLFDFNK